MSIDFEKIVRDGCFDLHIHTTASDGVYSPKEIVKKAYHEGLKIIAITDHDTMDGLEEACQAGIEYGVKVIPGIEISTRYANKNVDILGYGITETIKLADILHIMREGRIERTLQIIKKFEELGMPISLEDVMEFSKGHVIARPHIAQAIVKKEYLPNTQIVFDLYLADGKPCHEEKVNLSVQEGIDFIHEAGGKAVLAHPLLINNDRVVEEILQKHPFDGIEVWHRKHESTDQKRYRKLARKYRLFVTGGSDFHNDDHQLGSFGYHRK